VKKLAYILSFIFISFLVAPSIITIVNDQADISVAFNLDEEENSSKNQVDLEFHFAEIRKNEESILFHQKHDDEFHYKERNYLVILNVLSPPPKAA